MVFRNEAGFIGLDLSAHRSVKFVSSLTDPDSIKLVPFYRSLLSRIIFADRKRKKCVSQHLDVHLSRC